MFPRVRFCATTRKVDSVFFFEFCEYFQSFILLQILYVCLFIVYKVKNDKVVVNPFVPKVRTFYPLKTLEDFTVL